MNVPCKIHFHPDAAPLFSQLPATYQKYVCDPELDGDDAVLSLFSQSAFYIDFTHGVILRTRASGQKESDPIDFPVASVSHIEWFYNPNVPPPLTPFVGRKAY